MNGPPTQPAGYPGQYRMPSQRGSPLGSMGWKQLPPSGEVCKLWNQNQCRFSRCRHTHVCMRCGGNHPVLSCNLGSRLGD